MSQGVSLFGDNGYNGDVIFTDGFADSAAKAKSVAAKRAAIPHQFSPERPTLRAVAGGWSPQAGAANLSLAAMALAMPQRPFPHPAATDTNFHMMPRDAKGVTLVLPCSPSLMGPERTGIDAIKRRNGRPLPKDADV